MDRERVFALCLGAVFGFLPYAVKGMPPFVAWVGILGALVIGGLTFVPINPNLISLSALLIGSALFFVAVASWGYWRYFQSSPTDADYLYFEADVGRTGTTEGWPLVLNNHSFKPFSTVDSWFAPIKSKPGEDAYLSLRSLKVFASGPVHHGGFWVGKLIQAGEYRIEYHGIQEGISYAFVEFLRLRASENGNPPIQLIDVWKTGPSGRTKVYSSPGLSQPKNIDDPDAFLK